MKIGVLFLLAVPAVIACDSTTYAGDFVGTPSIRIAGTWSYNFIVYDADSGAYCTTSGNVMLNQSQNGDQFTGGVSGVFNCIENGYPGEEQTAIVPVTAGELAGASVRFIAFGCIHLGAVSGTPANHFTGTLNCTFPLSEFGPTRPMSGTWEATR
jgi:hypothetical protein